MARMEGDKDKNWLSKRTDWRKVCIACLLWIAERGNATEIGLAMSDGRPSSVDVVVHSNAVGMQYENPRTSAFEPNKKRQTPCKTDTKPQTHIAKGQRKDTPLTSSHSVGIVATYSSGVRVKAANNS